MRRSCQGIVEKFLASPKEHSNTLIIEGARQVGKTWLVESVLRRREKCIRINLEENPAARLEIDQTQDFDEFTRWLSLKFGFESNAGWVVFVDEAQESRNLGSYVRFMKEKWPLTKTILTGSSMSRLFGSGTQRVPVGRIQYLRVLPFSFQEFLRFNSKEDFFFSCKEDLEQRRAPPKFLHESLLSWFDKYLEVGGMPACVEAFFSQEDFKPVMASLVASQQDDFQRKEKTEEYLLIDALKGTANHVGSTAKYTHISTNYRTAKKAVDLCRQWGLIYEVEQKGSVDTQAMHPKWYLYDIGLLRYIRETAIPSISIVETLAAAQRQPLGGIIENAVLLSLFEGKGGYLPLSGWKKDNRSSIEVDFVYKGTETVPIEVKASLKTHKRHRSALTHYLERYGLRKGALISLAPYSESEQNGVTIVDWPAYMDPKILLGA